MNIAVLQLTRQKNNLHILQQDQKLQSRQIQGEFSHINLTKVDLEDQRNYYTH